MAESKPTAPIMAALPAVYPSYVLFGTRGELDGQPAAEYWPERVHAWGWNPKWEFYEALTLDETTGQLIPIPESMEVVGIFDDLTTPERIESAKADWLRLQDKQP